MIRPLRRAHRWIVLFLCVVLPAVVGVAVALRPDPPVQRPWPPQGQTGVGPGSDRGLTPSTQRIKVAETESFHARRTR